MVRNYEDFIDADAPLGHATGRSTRQQGKPSDVGNSLRAGSVAPVTSGEHPIPRRTTARGEATRARMISSAADLMYIRGVNAVTLDDVRAATGTSKSQLYKHFPDGKPELVRAVVALRAEQILAREGQRLA